MDAVIITLVHGTWARDAPWTQTTSTLAQALANVLGDIHFEPFAWSGTNSHRARWLAAHDLRRHISKCAVKYPPQNHFVIAHSHGGNALLYALRDEEAAKRVHGVVCLSSPFIHCRKRDLGPLGLLPIGVLLGGTVLWALARGIETTLPFLKGQFALLLAGALGLVSLVVLRRMLDLFLVRRFSISNASTAIARLSDSFRYPALPPDSILVVRAAGDEASAALATSHFLSLLLTVLSRAIGKLAVFGTWVEAINDGRPMLHRIALCLLFLSLGLVLLCFPMFRMGGPGIQFGISFLLGSIGVCFVVPKGFLLMPISFEGIAGCFIGIAGLPLLILSTLIAIVSSTFGLDTALLAPIFEISAETTPPGKVTLFEISATQARGLWHSTAYASEEAFYEIGLWIRARQNP